MDDFAAVDEVHEHSTPDIIQKLNTATGARRQPLIFEITAAGHDRHSVCRRHHEFSRKTPEDAIPHEASDSWFAVTGASVPPRGKPDGTAFIARMLATGVRDRDILDRSRSP